MTLEITGRNYEVTDRTRELIRKKLDKIKKYFNDIIEIRSVLAVQKYRNICEIIVVGKDFDLKATQEASTMEDAIVSTVDHLKRQAQKNRKKVTDHHRRGKVPPEVEPSITQPAAAPGAGSLTEATRRRRKSARPSAKAARRG